MEFYRYHITLLLFEGLCLDYGQIGINVVQCYIWRRKQEVFFFFFFFLLLLSTKLPIKVSNYKFLKKKKKVSNYKPQFFISNSQPKKKKLQNFVWVLCNLVHFFSFVYVCFKKKKKKNLVLSLSYHQTLTWINLLEVILSYLYYKNLGPKVVPIVKIMDGLEG